MISLTYSHTELFSTQAFLVSHVCLNVLQNENARHSLLYGVLTHSFYFNKLLKSNSQLPNIAIFYCNRARYCTSELDT